LDPEDKTGKGGFYSLPVGMAIIIFLAVLQGLTEFLPVSSSGHLVLAEILLDIRGEQVSMGIIFEIAVHVGTLGAIIMVYRRRVGSICMSFFSYVCSGFKPDENSREDIGFLCRVVIASIPAILA
jgi:undecaprenyl-diphosphatase